MQELKDLVTFSEGVVEGRRRRKKRRGERARYWRGRERRGELGKDGVALGFLYLE